MGRLTRDDQELFLDERPDLPQAVTLPLKQIDILGRLAARGRSDLLGLKPR